MAEPGEHNDDNDDNEPGPSAAADLGTADDRSAPDVTQPMDEHPVQTPAPAPMKPGEPRRSPDVLTLVVGLMSLAVATMVAAGWVPQLRLFDLRWVLSGGAVLLGVLLLAASVRSPQKR
ncbi:MAG TPA: hypothetical protein VL595_11950 [Pseudonocardia sp.]|nr:hypothetical protein [Pseudonocardia sp.]